MDETPPLPDDPRLRAIAETLEANGAVAELYDRKWRIVFVTTEMCRMNAVPTEDAERVYGLSLIARDLQYPGVWGGPDEGSLQQFAEKVVPLIVADVPPEDPDFAEVFGPYREVAPEIGPSEPAPLLTTLPMHFPDRQRSLNTWSGEVEILYQRTFDSDGSLLGVVVIYRPALQATLAARLARGEQEVLERIGRLSEPGRRPAAILFADLEGSGELSRRLSSQAYFGLIRALTDLIDESVASNHGITGKHAGDGGSALFVVEDGDEGVAAAGAIRAARAIRAGADMLIADGGTEIRVNVGLHWGATLMVGQVSHGGRLEVTALGDEMNEAARIEAVAAGGAILASKPLVERLDPADAEDLGIDQHALPYRPLSELGAEGKALRDAGTIAVAEL
ncbi:MAG: adenylate/guanylate cyclase domain-containing protein [Solirubrobacterales bacterium]|nr:adenylate/guanylate cyclase domain-containing protein [Solirubrobacterales bacterium]